MKEVVLNWLIESGLSETYAPAIMNVALVAAIIVLALLADLFTKRLIISAVRLFVIKSRGSWDDVLYKKKVFHRLSHIAPALVVYLLAPMAFGDSPLLGALLEKAAVVYMIAVAVLVVDSFLNSVHEIYSTMGAADKFPLKGVIQAVKIIIYFLCVIFVLSALTGRAPLYFLSGLGALTAVLMLIFKDAILGFVAGIQLSTLDMVREGDWIEMPQYGADGDVIDVSLTTVKIQNWDKTISSVPAYALISESFKNWRGMSESGGRRIKRALYIDMTSIKFLDEELLARLMNVQYINEYLQKKIKEVQKYNEALKVDAASLINGRRLTNIGTFRGYVEAYLRHHPKIHQDMTFLVRQLMLTEHGLPLEIYVFSNDQVWANYEAIQSDIFDHLIAALSEFDLRIYQQPSGADFRDLLKR